MGRVHILYILPPYTHTQRANGTNVYYKVAAEGVGGEGPLSSELFQAAEKPIPGVPGGMVSLAGDDWIGVSWINVSNAEKYQVYWWQVGDTVPQSMDDATSPTRINGLTVGQDYFISVQASNRGAVPATTINTALLNSARTVTTKGTLPSAPLELLAIPGDGVVDLSWQASGAIANASGYRVYGVQGTDVRRHTNLFLGETTNLNFSHGGLLNQQRYTFLVSAFNDFGESIGSVTVAAIPQAVIPDAPQNVTAIGRDSSVSINWTIDEGVAQYNVYRIAEDDSKTVFANVFPATTIPAINGEDYRFYVSSISGVGQEGIDSIIVTAMASVQAPRGLEYGFYCCGK